MRKPIIAGNWKMNKTPEEADQLAVLDKLKEENLNLESYSVSGGKLHLSLRMRQKDYVEALRKFVSNLEGFKIEDLY